jgi:ParB family transcriptional regulator, chromosome partitioning protein
MSAKRIQTVAASGAEVLIPLDKLKKSPKNARKTPHSEASIEAYAASIAAKGILQNLVVEPELNGEGAATGFYFVTIGEGRRLAQLLRVKRKQIKKTEPIRCVIDTANDPHEISLDENVTRENMHPADQFEAFKKLADERGFGAEEIAARFGVTAHVVRQRLRLSAVSPRLIEAYRNGEMGFEQVVAFALIDGHARQEAIYSRLSYSRDPVTIRRMLTEAVSAEAAGRMADMKKPDMAEAAEQLLAMTDWLPVLMRTPQTALEYAAQSPTDAATVGHTNACADAAE